MGAVSSTGIGDAEAKTETEANVGGDNSRTHGDSISPPCGTSTSTASGADDCCSPSGTSDPYRPYREFAPNKKTTFDNLPDEVLIKILAAVSSSAEKPADVVAPSMTCRRWRRANNSREVRRRTSRYGVGVRPPHWGEGAVWFLQRLCDAGCLEACFMLGMILFYCIPGGQLDGGKLLLHSAKAGHAASLHSLGIMSFNGSGIGAHSKDSKSGLALCAKAAALGHVEAMREVGLCLLDGFGVKQSHVDGYSLLLKAQLAELGVQDALWETDPRPQDRKRPRSSCDEHRVQKRQRADVFGNAVSISQQEQEEAVSRLLQVPSPEVLASRCQNAESPVGAVASAVLQLVRAADPTTLSQLRPVLHQLEGPLVDAPVHPAHRFIAEWFARPESRDSKEETIVEVKGGMPRVRSASLGRCSRRGCGRREMRPLEFWRCASCWSARYCSRACQLQDWRNEHRAGCKPLESRTA